MEPRFEGSIRGPGGYWSLLIDNAVCMERDVCTASSV